MSLQEVRPKYPQYIMNPPQLYCAAAAAAAAGGSSDDVFVPNNYKQQLTLWNDQHLALGGQRYSSSSVTGCDDIHEINDDDDDECINENDLVLIKVTD